jgi:hypothetical protein
MMNKKTEAKCSGAMLTVGFHAANPPLIWRFDLERNHSFTLALQGEDGDWELGVTSPKGDFYPVVHFAAREDAEEAFAKVEKALSFRKGASSAIGKALLMLVGAIMLVAVGVLAFGMYVNHLGHETVSGLATPITPPVTMTAPQQEGIPLPADEVLKPPPH